MTLRQFIFKTLEKSDRDNFYGRCVDIALVFLITINVVSVVLESVEAISARYGSVFAAIETISVAIFTVEYLLRLWVCVENEKYQNTSFPRMRYIFSAGALIDLLAILPFYLTLFFTLDLRFLRALRLLRILKLTRYSAAMTMLLDVIKEEANAFLAAIFILLVLLVLAASGAYLAEHDVQPEKFGSIPAAMWWAMATLTTLGYGDVVPATPVGKIFGAFVTVIGIGMAALPAGILASGMADQLHRKRERLSQEFRKALEDGRIDADEEAEIEELRRELGLSATIVETIRRKTQQDKDLGKLKHCPHCGGSLSSFPAKE